MKQTGPNQFQHGYASAQRDDYKYMVCSGWSGGAPVSKLAHPAQSPDLNPTEHLWDMIGMQTPPQTTQPYVAARPHYRSCG